MFKFRRKEIEDVVRTRSYTVSNDPSAIHTHASVHQRSTKGDFVTKRVWPRPVCELLWATAFTSAYHNKGHANANKALSSRTASQVAQEESKARVYCSYAMVHITYSCY